MRAKSNEKFKNSIKDITTRSHNLDKEVIEKLNRVIRGTVNYFGTKFSTMKTTFQALDKWIRKRIRCMKQKRISQADNCSVKTHSSRRWVSLTAMTYTKQDCVVKITPLIKG